MSQDPQQNTSAATRSPSSEVATDSTPDVAHLIGSACVACRRAIDGGPYYRVGPQTLCPQCAIQVQGLEQLNRFDFGAWMTGAILGLMVAIACGILWAVIVKATGYELGLAAVGVGFAVSWAAMKGSGGRRGPSIQTLAIVLAIIGIIIGKGLMVTWVFWDEVRQELPPGADTGLIRLYLFVMAPILGFSGFDLLWYGFAIWEAFRIPRAIRIPIHGPYSDAQQPGARLQFDTVQPAAASIPPPMPPSPPPAQGA